MFKMKLPTDKKQRTQVLAGIAIGAVVVVGAAIYFGVLPVLKSKKEKLARIVELQEELDKANIEIKKMANVIEKNREVLTKTKEISDKYLLQQVLDNYKIPATEILETQAKKVGITIAVKDGGMSDVASPPNQKATRTVRCYTAKVSAECGYNDLIKLLKQIESINPYFCVISVTVAGQPLQPDPTKQLIGVEVQWPTWVDPGMSAKLDSKLAKLNEDVKSEAKGDAKPAKKN